MRLVTILTLLCVSFTLILPSCLGGRKYKMPSQEEIEKGISENLDSLVNVLEMEIDPNSLSDKDKADYGYWLTYLHTLQSRSLINDTLIHFSTHYYEQHDSSKLFRAYYLAAHQVSWTAEDNVQEESLLHKSLQQTLLQDNPDIIKEAYVRLVRFYSLYKDPLKAIEISRQLLDIVNDDELYFPIISITGEFGNLKDDMPSATDSILKYTQMGIDRGLTNPEVNRMQVEGLLLAGRSKEALQILNTVREKFPNNIAIRLNYITTWFNLNQPDSAKAHIDYLTSLASSIKNEPQETETILFLMKAFQLVYDKMKGLPITLFDIGNYGDEMMTKARNRIKLDRERQFVQNKLEQDNLRLDIERGQLRQSLLLLVVCVLIVVVLLIYFYQRKLLEKERSTQQVRKQLQSHLLELNENRMIIDQNEQLIQTLNTQLNESKDMKESLQGQIDGIAQLTEDNERLKNKNESLLKDIRSYSSALQEKDQEMSSYERLTDQNRILQERERFLTSQLIDHIDILRQLRLKPRYIEENQWPEIVNIVNLLYDNFLHRLHKNHPTLTDEDLRYCALIKLGFSNTVIAIHTAISPSSVTKRKQRIKEKIKQERPDYLNREEPLEIYLWNY